MIVAAAAAAAATDRPNRSSSDSSQERRRRGSGGGQLRASEPPIVRLMTPCLGGCELLRSVMDALCLSAVLSRVLGVVCWLLLATIRTYVVIVVRE